MRDDNIVTVTGYRGRNGELTIFCPYCGMLHIHGDTYDNPVFGSRVPHCLIRYHTKQYSIEPPLGGPLPEHLLKAARINKRRLTTATRKHTVYEPVIPDTD